MSDSPRDKLLRDMKRTKGARFNAARRLERQEQKMSRNASYASGAVIIITLLPAFFKLEEFWVAAIALLTISLSVFILVFTLLHSGNKSALKADQFQRCALEVNALRRSILSNENADIAEFTKKYDDVLSRYSVNHDEVDYDKYRLEHPDEFENVAKEEIEQARKKVSSLEKSVTLAGAAITVLTLAITILSVLTSSAFGEALYHSISKLF